MQVGIEAQTSTALDNLAVILKAAGSSFEQLVKLTIFYADVADFPIINEIFQARMPNPPPAKSAPANLRLPRGLLISVEAIALAAE